MNTFKQGGDVCRVSVEAGGQEKLNIWSVLMFEPSRSQNLLKYVKKCETKYSCMPDGVKNKKCVCVGGGGIFFY